MYEIVFSYYQVKTSKFTGYRPVYLRKNKAFKKNIHKKFFTIHEGLEELKSVYTKILFTHGFVYIIEATLERNDKLIDISNKVVFDYL
jgi:hypothetical protein